jgi:hypothetical protein
MCLSSVKSFTEFEFCAEKAISGSYGLENSQKILKKAKNFIKSQNLPKIELYGAFHV